MPTHTHSHRWILALPLVLAVVVLTLREGMTRSSAGDLLAGPDTRVQGDAGAEYDVTDDGVDLRSGNLLVDAPGLATVYAAGWDVSAWGGSMYVSVQRGRVTVAALDTPVLARSVHGNAVIAPGSQWRASDTDLPDPATDLAAWTVATAAQPVPQRFLDEQKDIVAAWRSERTPASASDNDLPRLALETKPTRALVAALRLRSDLRLYVLLQPATRDAAWAYLPSEIDSSVWTALLVLPLLERADVTASPLTVRLWGETLARAFSASTDPDATRSATLPLLEKQIGAIVADGYPLRALRFAEAVSASVGTGATLTPEANAVLERLHRMTAETLRADALSMLPALASEAPSYAASLTPAPAVADPALEARAHDVLTARGAMFTRDSAIKTASEGMVDVRGVVFGLPSGDKAPHFVFNPDTGMARAIIEGKVQPYDVPFDAYLEWEAAR